MPYPKALAIAVGTAIYWFIVAFCYYATVAGDHYPLDQPPSALESYGPGAVVLIAGILIYSFVVFVLNRGRR